MGTDSLRVICESAALACAAGVGVCTIGVGTCWIAKKVVRSARRIAAVSLVGAVLIGGMVVVGTDGAGTKPNTNDVTHVVGDTNTTQQTEGGTNDVGQTGGDLSGTNGTGGVGGSLMLGLFGRPNLGQMFETITDEDIAQGWRVFSVVSNNTTTADVFSFSNANAACASVWEAAQRHGAVYGHWALPLGEWLFPFGDSGWTHPFLRCEGVLRDSFREDVNQIHFLAPFALCPAANWPRYGLDASRAWFATNDVGGLTVAVENGALGNDPAQIVRARIDLDPSLGEIRLRYDLSRIGETTFDVGPTLNGTNTFVTVGSNTSEVVFRRVHPDDFDFDGLPNALDPHPRQRDADAGWNQSDTWAMFAFPSNAAEIAAMGYAAWAAARAAEPNRLLLGLEFASAKNAWPVCFTFGDVQVMCDGSEEMFFPIDRGAHYPFSLSGGELVGARVVDTLWFADFFPDLWFVPYDRQVGDLTVHLDSPGSGWIGTTAEVAVDGLDGTHFFPNDSKSVTAVVTNCHADAYIDCTWSGGEGVTFSNRHSLETVITWQTTNSVAWATNRVTLVTTYEGGYAITNGYVVSVGPQAEPTTTFTLDCPAVQFLNDGIGGDRPERVYRVSARLLAAQGTRGTVTLACSGGTATTFYHSESRRWPVSIPETFPLEVPSSGGFESGMDFYITSAQLGRGTIDAVLVLDDEGGRHEVSVPFQVIEPIRRLVTTDRTDDGRSVNPSRLVYGTNAVLKVRVNLASGDVFSKTNDVFHRVDGPGEIVSQWRVGNNWFANVHATSDDGELVVEARFNDDAIQPRFVLPIVRERRLAVRAFVIEPPQGFSRRKWTDRKIRTMFDEANRIYLQAGIFFDLLEIRRDLPPSVSWSMPLYSNPNSFVLSDQATAMFDHHKPSWWRLSGDCIEVYFGGKFTDDDALGIWTEYGIFISRKGTANTLAHELGHALGLNDCYGTTAGVTMACMNSLVNHSHFAEASRDWGMESGRGFYRKTDRYKRLIQYLLMHGYDALRDGDDIPDASFEGFSTEVPPREHPVEVGVSYISLSDSEVYSK